MSPVSAPPALRKAATFETFAVHAARIRDYAVENTIKSIAGLPHVLRRQRRFGGTERTSGSSLCEAQTLVEQNAG